MVTPLLAIVLSVGLVLIEPDLGTSSIVGLIGFSLLFVAGVPCGGCWYQGLAQLRSPSR